MLEMLVVLAIAAAVATAAAPSFNALRARIALDAASHAFLTTLHQARGEAMARQQRVTVAPMDGGDWRSGWMTFVDDNLNGRIDFNEVELTRHPALASFIVARTRLTAGELPSVSFDASGFARSGAWQWLSGSVMFAANGDRRCIVVNAFGRPRQLTHADAGACAAAALHQRR
ncbi:hypothetical protein GCM10027419_22400 [Pandoraea terrae]